MMTFIRNKKQFTITIKNRQRILKEIEDLANLPNEVYVKIKQYEHGYYIKIIVDKTYIKDNNPENKYNSIPDTIMFLMVVDHTFPKEPPKLFCQMNFCFPNLIGNLK